MNFDDPSPTLQAYLDGELDAAASLELEARMAENPALRASYERLRELSSAVRENADYHRAPPGLLKRLDTGNRPRAALRPLWLSTAAACLAVAAFALGVLIRPAGEDPVTSQLVASHVRSTLGGRLFDVASSDRHTVKPWLSARLPFSPPVVDLAARGFPLAGARADFVDGHPVAVLVYQRRRHMVDAFVWPRSGRALSETKTSDGFNVECFARGAMQYCLVSDLERADLEELARLLRTPAS